MTADEKVSVITEAANKLKADRVVVLDVQMQTQIADFFVICSGTSDTHIRAIAEEMIEKMREHGVSKPRREGLEAARWVLLDYGDVVVHIFAPEEREYYDLESFWSGARVVELLQASRLHEQATV